MKIYPFIEGDTFATFRNLIKKVIQEIQSLDNEYVMKVSKTELEDYYVNKVTIRPLIFHTDQYYIENQAGTKINLSHDFRRTMFPSRHAITQGTLLDIAIPYEVDSLLWRIQPSTFNLHDYPLIDVRDDSIVLSVSFPDNSADPERLKSEINRHVQSLVDAVQNLNRDVKKHNSSAPLTVKSALQQKRKLAESTIGAVVSLGIPIKHLDKPLAFTIPTKRRKLPAMQPEIPT